MPKIHLIRCDRETKTIVRHYYGTRLHLQVFLLLQSLHLCPTLCNPIDGSPSGSPIPGILQARTLQWVAISFSNAWKWKVKVKSLNHVRLLATPWTAAHQAPPSMGFSRQEYWSGVPLPSPQVFLRKPMCSMTYDIQPHAVKNVTFWQSSNINKCGSLRENNTDNSDKISFTHKSNLQLLRLHKAFRQMLILKLYYHVALASLYTKRKYLHISQYLLSHLYKLTRSNKTMYQLNESW